MMLFGILAYKKMMYDPRILEVNLTLCFMKGLEYDTPDRPYWFQFFIPNLNQEEAHIVELLSSRKVDTQLFRNTKI